MLGFRGHFSTKSRRYSTTLGALRQTRADYRAAQQRAAFGLPDPDDEEATTLTLAHWTYAGHGHTPGESWLAANIRRDIQHSREIAREELPAQVQPLEGVRPDPLETSGVVHGRPVPAHPRKCRPGVHPHTA